MLGDLTRKYLDELQKTQKKVKCVDARKSSFDETSEDTYEVLTSEYHLEIGPLKLNVKKSSARSGTKSLSKSSSQAINKQGLLEESQENSKEEVQSAKLAQSGNESSPRNSINITI